MYLKKRLYFWMYNKSNSRKLSTLFASVGSVIFNTVYILKSLSVKKDFISLSHEEALELAEKTSPKPEATYKINDFSIKSQVDLSIIIPVYNMELYLNACMKSVIEQQTTYDYEIIVVNDGSTDSSRSILEKYSHYDNVKIHEQANQGLSGARNTGINNAKGKYLMFLDSDDVIDSSMVQEMLSAAFSNKVEIVECGYSELYLNGKKRDYLYKDARLGQNNMDVLIDRSGFACMKVFERSLFEQVRFPVGYWYEDTIIKFIVFRISNTFLYLPKTFYQYRINEKSITQTSVNSPKAIDAYWVLEYLVSLSNELNIRDRVSLYKVLLVHLSSMFYSRTANLDPEVRRAVFILGATLLKENAPTQPYKLQYMYKELEKTFFEKDFAKWELVCKYI